MPALRNIVWESFARNRVKGLGVTESYLKAKGTTTKNKRSAATQGSRMQKRPEVAGRIAELLEAQAAKVTVTVPQLLKELEQARLGSAVTGQWASAVGAILGKARLMGLLIDRKEVEIIHRKPSRVPVDEDQQISLAEWEKRFAPKRQDKLVYQPGNGHDPDDGQT
jgi:hypothetical protein